MENLETLIAFGALMLVIALLAVAIDWFGKPLKHRKFVPKIYRFPDERQPKRSQVRETQWSDTAFVLPVAETRPELLVRYPDHRVSPGLGPTMIPPQPARDLGPPTAQVPFVDLDVDGSPGSVGAGADARAPIEHTPVTPNGDHPPGEADSFIPGLVTLEDIERSPDHTSPGADLHGGSTAANGTTIDPAGSADPPDTPDPADAHENSDAIDGPAEDHDRDGADPAADVTEPAEGTPSDAEAPRRVAGWAPGDYVFNFTTSGDEPSSSTVRSRYWKNVASISGAAMFGRANTERMTSGKPPERRNPRTGKIEVMRLPRVHFGDTGGRTPIPEWPSSEVDPFAD